MIRSQECTIFVPKIVVQRALRYQINVFFLFFLAKVDISKVSRVFHVLPVNIFAFTSPHMLHYTASYLTWSTSDINSSRTTLVCCLHFEKSLTLTKIDQFLKLYDPTSQFISCKLIVIFLIWNDKISTHKNSPILATTLHRQNSWKEDR